jgi:hypothetical protein
MYTSHNCVHPSHRYWHSAHTQTHTHTHTHTHTGSRGRVRPKHQGHKSSRSLGGAPAAAGWVVGLGGADGSRGSGVPMPPFPRPTNSQCPQFARYASAPGPRFRAGGGAWFVVPQSGYYEGGLGEGGGGGGGDVGGGGGRLESPPIRVPRPAAFWDLSPLGLSYGEEARSKVSKVMYTVIFSW